MFGAVLTALLTCGQAVVGQDIEALAASRGIQLPGAYFRQVQEHPGFYEFERALFNRVEIGQTAARGEVRLPVVLSLFSDSPEDPLISREMVQAALFSGPAEHGTITDSYLEMSRGVLNVGGDVHGWVRSSLTMLEVVGLDRGFGSDARIGEYLLEALNAVDADVDFSVYDNDGPDGVANSGDDDGFVDVIVFEYLEVAASCGGPAIWPHRATIQGRTGTAYETDDVGVGGGPIFVQDYITQSASACSGDVVQDAAVITHEFGHALGLPDWYHWIDLDLGPYGRRWVLGCWALMAAGSWGCGPVTDDRAPFGPTHMIGYSKERLGWVEYLDPGEVWNQEFVLGPAEFDGSVMRIPLDDQGAEFLWMEFRAQVGFDEQLPGSGVLMYKQDENASRRPDPASSDPYFLQMIEQDANSSLRKMAAEGGSRGEIGDAWGVETGRKLNGETTPSLRLADGSWATTMVHEVWVDGDEAHVVLSTGLQPKLFGLAPAVEVMKVRTFSIPLRIAGGRGPYEGVGDDLPVGFSLAVSGDELVLVGSLTGAGPVEVDLAVRDSEARVSESTSITISAPLEWEVEIEHLLQRFLQTDGDPLTPAELAYLDTVGNGNGGYDVGDLRKWLRDHPTAPNGLR